MTKARRRPPPRPEVFRHGGRTSDGRRIIVVGGKEHERDAHPAPRLRPSVVDEMQSRNLFDRHDAIRNSALAECARTLAKHWHAAGLAERPTTVDLLATGAGTGDKAYMTPTSEHAARARDEIRMAMGMIGPRCWPCVHAVVCEDRPLEIVGAEQSAYTNGPKARIVAIERVVAGIEIIAAEWGYTR